MGTRSAFSLSKALAEAVGFLPKALGGAWLVLLLAMGVAVAPGVMCQHGLFMGWMPLAWLVAAIIVKLMLIGGLYRLALFGKDAVREGLGVGGVQFGMPELRILVANIVVALFVFLIAMALFIVFAIAFETSGLGEGYANTHDAVRALVHSNGAAAWIVMAYFVFALWFLVFVVLKFSLMHAATIAERRIVTLNALGLSAGNVFKLLLGQIVLLLPFILAGLVLMHLFGGAVVHLHGLHLVFHGILAVLVPPLIAGFLASAYRQITSNRTK